MKQLLLLTFFLTGVVLVAGQVKVVSGSDPVFPDEIKKSIYGDSVKVVFSVDKKGRVTAARTIGPMEPCTNRKDPNVKTIRDIALNAVKSTVFEPVLQDGKPVEAVLNVVYQFGEKPIDPTEEAKKKWVKGGVLNGRALVLAKPEYPSSARGVRAGGPVQVGVLIGEDGNVISAGPLSGHLTLLETVVDAACDSKFSPTLLNGQPVKISGVITYNFVP